MVSKAKLIARDDGSLLAKYQANQVRPGISISKAFSLANEAAEYTAVATVTVVESCSSSCLRQSESGKFSEYSSRLLICEVQLGSFYQTHYFALFAANSNSWATLLY